MFCEKFSDFKKNSRTQKFRSTILKYELKTVGKKNNMYKERNISKVLPGLKGSPEGDQPLDYKQKLRKSQKMFLTLPKELFKIWEPYKGGRFFFNQIRIFHEWKVHVYLKRREVNGNLRG